MVSIAAFQAVDPGSIPGRRNIFLRVVGSSPTLGATFFCILVTGHHVGRDGFCTAAGAMWTHKGAMA